MAQTHTKGKPSKVRSLARGLQNVLSLKTQTTVNVHGHQMHAQTLDRSVALLLWKFSLLAKEEIKILSDVVSKGMKVVDIGANLGFHALELARLVGSEGKVFAFEPEPQNFALLKKNIESNQYGQIMAINKAVGDKTGPIDLYFCNEHRGDHRIFDSFDGREKVQIDCIRLDDYFKGDEQIDVMKIDVQGAEHLVFKGMRQFLKRQRNIKILMEFSPELLEASGSSAQELLNLINEGGFSIKKVESGLIKDITAEELVKETQGSSYTNVFLEKKPIYVLGLSSYSHEASCALIKDGKILSLLEEERLNREKHTWRFPKNAIRECLKMEGITLDQVDHITFFWKPIMELSGNLNHVMKYFPSTLNLFRSPSGGEELSFLSRIYSMQNIPLDLQKEFGLKRKPKVKFVEHHLAHAASAFFVSPFSEAAILTMDGRGESTSTLLSVGRKNKIEKIEEIKVPHSLGLLYASITHYLGFKPLFDEWKVMGMSAYGKDQYIKAFEDLVELKSDGTYALNLKYFRFHTHGLRELLSDEFIKKFGPKRKKNDPYDQRHFDLAYALQALVEKTGVHLANGLQKRTGMTNLCMTGGVVLNCLMNKRIVEETNYKGFFFQPVASDAGTSLGSALYFYHQQLGKERKEVFSSPYLGTSFTNDEIKKALDAKGVSYRLSKDIAAETAEHIAQGKIVGWFQGRMEAGPRALGNRSITVTPMDPKMKDRLNERVKRREFFRPFAPSVLEEKVHEYFIMPKNQPSPYMILIADVKENKKDVIPAVTHADGTARVHTVSKDVNPLYWRLISEFEKITGVAVLINTSFNENEPIVATPQEAIDCYLRTEFDVLAIGDYLLEKGKK